LDVINFLEPDFRTAIENPITSEYAVIQDLGAS
jgi:hypothetical protein